MKRPAGKFISAAMMGLILAIPTAVSAREKRGVGLVVTRLDGRRVRGELLAVKQDLLILLSPGFGSETVEIADVRTVRIVRRSHAWTLALAGSLAGAVTGAVLGYGQFDFDTEAGGALFGAGIVGGLGALAGLGLSLAVGRDATFVVAGESEAFVRSLLERLRDHSREARYRAMPSPEARRPEPGPPPAAARPKPGAPPSTPARPQRRQRFRLGLGASFVFGPAGYKSTSMEGSFRFPGDVPPEEAGPHPVTFAQRNWARDVAAAVGPVSLSYEWKSHWSAEVEFYAAARPREGESFGELRFTSTTDGKVYHTYLYSKDSVSFTSLLVGLTYRTKTPSIWDRHVLEGGMAAGPAWGRNGRLRRTALSGRVHVAYDFYFRPNLSIGASLGFRYFETDSPSWTISHEMGYWEVGGPSDIQFTRLTEVFQPGRRMEGSGLFLGVRAGFRL